MPDHTSSCARMDEADYYWPSCTRRSGPDRCYLFLILCRHHHFIFTLLGYLSPPCPHCWLISHPHVHIVGLSLTLMSTLLGYLLTSYPQCLDISHSHVDIVGISPNLISTLLGYLSLSCPHCWDISHPHANIIGISLTLISDCRHISHSHVHIFLRTSGRCNRQSEFTLLHFTIFH